MVHLNANSPSFNLWFNGGVKNERGGQRETEPALRMDRPQHKHVHNPQHKHTHGVSSCLRQEVSDGVDKLWLTLGVHPVAGIKGLHLVVWEEGGNDLRVGVEDIV